MPRVSLPPLASRVLSACLVLACLGVSKSLLACDAGRIWFGVRAHDVAWLAL